MPKYQDPLKEIGNVYGELTVIDFSGIHIRPSGRKYKRLIVQCSCGAIKDVNMQDLTSGRTKTCGESNKHPYYKDRTVPAFNAYIKKAKRDIQSKGLPFEFTPEEFRNITQQNCFYCNESPSATRRTTKTGKMLSEYISNGVDRLDSSKGYTHENCVPCCAKCNRAKNTMSKDEYIEMCRNVISVHGM
jgi:hypothetical protein